MFLFQTMKTGRTELSGSVLNFTKLSENNYAVTPSPNAQQITGIGILVKSQPGNQIIVDGGEKVDRIIGVLDKSTGNTSFLFKREGEDYYRTTPSFRLESEKNYNLERLFENTYRYNGSNYATGSAILVKAAGSEQIQVTKIDNSTDQTDRVFAVIDKTTNANRYFYKIPGNDYYTEVSGITMPEVPTGVREEGGVAKNFVLHQNYPNPFNPTTKISFNLEKAANVQLKVYDMAGKEVATLINEQTQAGEHSINFNASGLASGTYLFKLTAEGQTETRKMNLLK